MLTATIANNGTLSDICTLRGGLVPVAVEIPTITSAAISFDASCDGGTTYQSLWNLAGEINLAASTGAKTLALDPINWYGVTHFKVRSGLTGATVAQGAERILTFNLRHFG